jgi:ubiquinone biosynthesis protein
MKVARFFEIAFKLILCLPFRKFPIVRAAFLPIHIILFPHLLLKPYNARLAFILESLGGIFIKLGQSFSLKSFLFEKSTLKTLAYLQDRLPPTPLDIHKYLKEINPHLLNHKDFSVSTTPIASASIAQIYRAKLNGIDVVLKIVKPEIQQKIEQDFAIILFLGRIVNRFCSPALQLIEVLESIHEGILMELNLENEAKNLNEMRRSLALETSVHLPKSYCEFSNKQCLVLSFCEGLSLNVLIHSGAKINKNTVARNILEIYLKQVYENGIFHADMHSGNILVKNDGTISLIDFGLIATITEQDRKAVATLIFAFLQNDANLAMKTQLEAGYITQSIFYNYEYRLEMQKIAQEFSTNFNMSNFSNDLFKIMHKFNVFVPKHLLLLNKTILYVEDIIQQLAPTFKAFEIIEPWIKKWYFREQVRTITKKVAKLCGL